MTTHSVADRYALIQEIGRGGSGAVWLGHDEILGRHVAVKRIGIPPGADRADLERADREARLAARVAHPHVVSVFDFIEEADQQWLVMEYVEGTNLAQLVAESGGLSPAESARIVGAAAKGLAAAHQLGIVHRDVKPSNILVGKDGSVKLSDFGIARGAADASLTQTGLVTGSPAFLSPEVATGATATAASDVWALGATLFHALAGHAPYDASGNPENVLATLYRIANDEPPRLQTASWLSPVLESTMTRRAEERPTAAEIVAYLESQPSGGESTQVLTTLPAAPANQPAPAPATTPVPDSAPARREQPARSKRRRSLWILGAAVVAVLAVIGVLLLNPAEEDPDPTSGQAGQTPETSASQKPEPTSPSTSPTDQPTADELESFAQNYVATAAADPQAGFAMLTPEYQKASPRYADFWGSLRGTPTISRIAADPANLRVSYTYSYNLPGVGKRTEDVILQLAKSGESFLIAGAS